jgi:hypothetical protein
MHSFPILSNMRFVVSATTPTTITGVPCSHPYCNRDRANRSQFCGDKCAYDWELVTSGQQSQLFVQKHDALGRIIWMRIPSSFVPLQQQQQTAVVHQQKQQQQQQQTAVVHRQQQQQTAVVHRQQQQPQTANVHWQQQQQQQQLQQQLQLELQWNLQQQQQLQLQLQQQRQQREQQRILQQQREQQPHLQYQQQRLRQLQQQWNLQQPQQQQQQPKPQQQQPQQQQPQQQQQQQKNLDKCRLPSYSHFSDPGSFCCNYGEYRNKCFDITTICHHDQCVRIAAAGSNFCVAHSRENDIPIEVKMLGTYTDPNFQRDDDYDGY